MLWYVCIVQQPVTCIQDWSINAFILGILSYLVPPPLCLYTGTVYFVETGNENNIVPFGQEKIEKYLVQILNLVKLTRQKPIQISTLVACVTVSVCTY